VLTAAVIMQTPATLAGKGESSPRHTHIDNEIAQI
jgi:hypothetical protein